MRIAAKKRRGATANRSEARQLPKFVLPGKIALAAIAVVACFAILLILPSPEDDGANGSAQIAADLPPANNLPGSDVWRVSKPTPQEPASPAIEPATEQAALPPAEQPWLDQVVKKGDNLSLIFQRAGFNKGDVYQVVTGSAEGKSLARIYPGQIISFQADASGELAAVRVVRSALETVTYRRGDEGFNAEVVSRTPETRESWATAEITSSLFMAGKEAGLSHTTIMDLATIFGGVIDFVQDPRQGDTIQVVYEEFYLDDKK